MADDRGLLQGKWCGDRSRIFKDYDLQGNCIEIKKLIWLEFSISRLDSHLRLAGKDKFGSMRSTDRDL